ncbi:MvaI/BcnI family restriction endonuclease [Planococcus salinarum]|uniref:MvaI/BcnI family restriction endonuclease n=1 Tax=Planococcus salinarum TaxID=622695 RepID=UPI000E3CC205|nr:MvaI/BcnI family restriction endonuclease [Planococcus salinarum]TAA71930.1 hypothetical protein D2909_08895 [Planococcus salinarum]
MDIFRQAELIEDVFCKALSTNDDSGRHGVLIPVFAYHLFPSFTTFDPAVQINYEEPITTIWPQMNARDIKASKWKHYHRYPERRMTSLQPELLNSKPAGSMLVVGKYKNRSEYECLVITPDNPQYMEIGSKFLLDNENEERHFTGAAIIPIEEFLKDEKEITPLDELMELFENVSAQGFIENKKDGDTGIGFTFETLLGIKSNSSKTPDYKGIEIKCSRSKKSKEKRTSPSGKQTLFSLIPNWDTVSSRRGLIERYGVDDPLKNRTSIYCTIKILPNSYGWNLEIDEESHIIYVCNRGQRVVYYTMDDLRDALESKHRESVFITAETRLNGNNKEEFHYDSLTHCREVLFSEYLALIRENLAGLDFAIHMKDGKVRDHGFLWRMDSKKYLLRLFKYVQEIK